MRTSLVGFFVFLLLGTACVKDYYMIDKRGQYQGFIRDSNSDTTYFDRNNRVRDWRDKDSGSVYDGRNNMKGGIYGTDNDSDD